MIAKFGKSIRITIACDIWTTKSLRGSYSAGEKKWDSAILRIEFDKKKKKFIWHTTKSYDINIL